MIGQMAAIKLSSDAMSCARELRIVGDALRWSSVISRTKKCMKAMSRAIDSRHPSLRRVPLASGLMGSGLLWLAGSFAQPLYSQTVPQSGSSAPWQAQSARGNCTDPSSAGAPGCLSQTSDSAISIQSSQPRNSAPGEYETPLGNRNGSYTDIESVPQASKLQSQPRLPTLQPEPLTEFQKFIASTTNQVLPIYGASLFSGVPSTFAPLDLAPIPSDYAIGPGDELRIRIWGQVNFQINVRVDRTGEIFLPQVG